MLSATCKAQMATTNPALEALQLINNTIVDYTSSMEEYRIELEKCQKGANALKTMQTVSQISTLLVDVVKASTELANSIKASRDVPNFKMLELQMIVMSLAYDKEIVSKVIVQTNLVTMDESDRISAIDMIVTSLGLTVEKMRNLKEWLDNKNVNQVKDKYIEQNYNTCPSFIGTKRY